MAYRASAPREVPSGELVTVRTYADEVGARLDAVALAQEGVFAEVFDSGSHNAVVRGAVSLRVRDSELHRAKVLLDELVAKTHQSDDDEEDGVRCPECELPYCSYERTRIDAPGKLFLIAMLASPLLLFTQKRWRCHRCGHVWDDPNAGPKKRTPAAPGDPVPVFRLVRRNGGMGLFLGIMAGLVLFLSLSQLREFRRSPLLPLAAAALPLVGWTLGRGRVEVVCSAPHCRTRLRSSFETCPGCGGEIAGAIATAAQHYVAVANVRRELAEARARDEQRRQGKLARAKA